MFKFIWFIVYDKITINFKKADITFNETILNIFANFAPNKLVTIDDRDPPWRNDEIKNKIKWKNGIYKNCTRKGSPNDYLRLQNAIQEVSNMISSRKEDYYNKLSKKLNNPKTSSKTYWSILKTFYNGRKVPLIPPLLINDHLVSDLKSKADYFMFNEFFCDQCTPIVNNSEIPQTISFLTNERFSSIEFDDQDIVKIIRALDISKAHGHDDITIRMIKICDAATVKPLLIIFKNCIDSSTFPSVWKNQMLYQFIKKEINNS